MWETWFIAITQPQVAGIFSPSIHSCLVVVSRSGLRIETAVVQAQPRLSWSLRTFSICRPLLPLYPCRKRVPTRLGGSSRDDTALLPARPGQERARREDP